MIKVTLRCARTPPYPKLFSNPLSRRQDQILCSLSVIRDPAFYSESGTDYLLYAVANINSLTDGISQ